MRRALFVPLGFGSGRLDEHPTGGFPRRTTIMLAFLGHGLKPTIYLTLSLLLILNQFVAVVGLRTAPSSPCEDVCHRQSTNTTSKEIVCLDSQYNTTSTGSHFEECVDCQLRSNYTDGASGESDVSWGIYNIRYAFSSCLYGYPKQVGNYSSPCLVTCSSMSPALDSQLVNADPANLFGWCGSIDFPDVVVDQCSFCYNLTTDQVYLGNFIEVLRYNCHFRTPTQTAFPIDPTKIFSQSILPSSSKSLLEPAKSGSNVNLPVAIAVPIVVFVVLVCALTICCFLCIRHRRKKANKSRASQNLNARWQDMALQSPAPWAQMNSYPMQQDPVMTPASFAFGPSPYVYGDPGTGVGFVGSDGRPLNMGVAKPDWVGTPQATMFSNGFTPSEQGPDKGQAQAQTFFPPPGAGTSPRNEGS